MDKELLKEFSEKVLSDLSKGVFSAKYKIGTYKLSYKIEHESFQVGVIPVGEKLDWPANPFSGYRFEPVSETGKFTKIIKDWESNDTIGQYATANQWERLGRKVKNCSDFIEKRKVYGTVACYYSYEQTEV